MFKTEKWIIVETLEVLWNRVDSRIIKSLSFTEKIKSDFNLVTFDEENVFKEMTMKMRHSFSNKWNQKRCVK